MAPPATTATGKAPEHPAGWARPAAYLGFASAVVTLGLGITAEALAPDIATSADASMYLSISGGILLAAGGPVVFIGGSSARFASSVTGSKLMRVLGWIGYGAGLIASLCGILWYSDAATVAPIRGVGVVSGVLGAGTFVAFALDALWSAQDADDLASIMTQAPPPPALRLAPVVSVTRGPNGLSPLLGLQGVF